MTELGPEKGLSSASQLLLIGIARSESGFEQLVNVFLDAGVPGGTVVESRGLASILRQELPIFSGLAALLPAASGSRVLLAIAPASAAETVLRFARQLPPSDRPIIAALPLAGSVLPGD